MDGYRPGQAPVSIAMRAMPANLQAEQSLLGGLMVNNKALDGVAEFLAADHFADPVHAAIYAAIQRRVEAGQTADVITLRPEFEAAGTLSPAGGVAYLAELLVHNVSVRNVPAYARLVHDAWLRRQLARACDSAISQALGEGGEITAPEVLDGLEESLTALADKRQGREASAGGDVATQVIEEMFGAIARRGGLAGITTGYRGLDRMTGGLRGGQMVILGARPAMGKTALLAGIAARAAAAGARVYFWGGEMLASAVMARLVAAAADLPLEAVTRGAMPEGESLRPLRTEDEETYRLRQQALRVGALPIAWDDQPALPVAVLRQRLRRHKRRHGLDLVCVDYLGLLRGGADAQRQSRYAEMSEISRGLKAIAMELQVPVVAAAQLNRANEGRENKRPQLSDLRDSGDIEQDADMVWFLHREHYYLQNGRPRRASHKSEEQYFAALGEWQRQLEAEEGKGELIIAKQRQGRVGPVRLRWLAEQTFYLDESDADGALPAAGGAG
ncbi:replicative DNA helicase [Paracraurococcus ruber]|nr:replicative DNA helicase [Paracraurococcus ruber]